MARATNLYGPQGTKYGRLTTDTDYRKGSEFGGLDGPIAPPPNDPGQHSAEMLMQVYQTNPAANYPTGKNLDNQRVPQTQLIKP